MPVAPALLGRSEGETIGRPLQELLVPAAGGLLEVGTNGYSFNVYADSAISEAAMADLETAVSAPVPDDCLLVVDGQLIFSGSIEGAATGTTTGGGSFTGGALFGPYRLIIQGKVLGPFARQRLVVLEAKPSKEIKVEAVSPEEYTGSVIGDLNSRRGQIQGQDMRGNATVVNAFVPLANMFGYVNTLRGMSQGRAAFTMQYDHYEPVPQHVADEVIKKYSA